MDPNQVNYFAQTDARNKREKFGIKAKDRTNHLYVIGKTGMGKSTLLENMIIQDIRNGDGLALIDPHGSLAEKVLDFIPEERLNDVVYFAPFDMEYPIAFNVMEDVGYDKRHLVVNGLMAAFKKIWLDAWSARMEYILTNTLLALLEYPDATMLGINKMYVDKVFRKKVVDHVQDPLVKAFWTEEFAHMTDQYTREATPAIQNKVGQFTGNPLIRNIVGQPKSTFDLRKIVDERKIFICNLSKGLVGEGNANLLGSMLITKIYLAAMSRADTSDVERGKLPNFYFYVDEFQSFANESFADILSEARKYKLNLTMAHQYIEQMSEEVRAAVFGNVGTMIVFRVGAYDAEILAKEFSPIFTEEDLVNLGFTQIYLKLMIDGVSSPPFSATTLPPYTEPDVSLRAQAIAMSRATFGRPRADVEAEVAQFHAPIPKPDGKELKERNGTSAGNTRTSFQEKGSESRRTQTQKKEKPRPPIEASTHKEQLAVIAKAMQEGTVEERETENDVRLRAKDEQSPQQKQHKVPQKKSKEPSKEHKESLRSALASVIGQAPSASTATSDDGTETKQKTPVPPDHDEQKAEETRTTKPTGEVPEEVLKKVLEIGE